METYIKMGYLLGFVTLDRTEEVSSKKSTAIAFIEDAFIWGKEKKQQQIQKNVNEGHRSFRRGFIREEFRNINST